jgi:hypothetical protein
MRFESWKDAGRSLKTEDTRLWKKRKIPESGHIAAEPRIKRVVPASNPPRCSETLPIQFRSLFALAKRWQFYTLVIVRAC